jgi:hypothetical protein
MAQHVHLVLGVVGTLREKPRELDAPLRPVRLGHQHGRVEQLVEQQRMPREVVGRPCRCAHEVGDARQQRRMLDHEREIRAAPATVSSSATSRSNTASGRTARDAAERRAGAAASARRTRWRDEAGSSR